MYFYIVSPLRNHIFSVQKAHFFAPAASHHNPTPGDVVTSAGDVVTSTPPNLRGGQSEGGDSPVYIP